MQFCPKLLIKGNVYKYFLRFNMISVYEKKCNMIASSSFYVRVSPCLLHSMLACVMKHTFAFLRADNVVYLRL